MTGGCEAASGLTANLFTTVVLSREPPGKTSCSASRRDRPGHPSSDQSCCLSVFPRGWSKEGLKVFLHGLRNAQSGEERCSLHLASRLRFPSPFSRINQKDIAPFLHVLTRDKDWEKTNQRAVGGGWRGNDELLPDGSFNPSLSFRFRDPTAVNPRWSASGACRGPISV
ncbi:uncharacterized protein BO66DRAFT_391250 [Aspergillus aculeatinus CBS 121060]|uniref:Uncharacterized protein n=1 Tax=Aspergillus aculeatinus CBS 121060 TaxID=1448322 RepID=A0ACD1HAH6_9EURO|nr:hypothetical protein BO66DRAFT_391250 [Aspergillus aculeatinus CBS 121060]RAH70806.1 hypothetical protein BO66DRAFT_391250 [Aspergillus aculeatinus CBS 121060]